MDHHQYFILVECCFEINILALNCLIVSPKIELDPFKSTTMSKMFKKFLLLGFSKVLYDVFCGLGL